MIDVSSTLSGLSGPMALVVILAIVFAESGLLVGFFLPGDSLLFAAGVLVAAGTLHIALPVLVVGVVLAAFAGDQVGYLIGRKVGPRVFRRDDSRLFSQAHAQRAHDFFAKHGPKAVILARFVPVVRSFTPTVAGVGRMGYRRFVSFNAVGALLWGAGMTCAGYALGGVSFVADNVEIMTIGIVLASNIPVVASVLRRRRHTSETDDTPASELTGVSG